MLLSIFQSLDDCSLVPVFLDMDLLEFIMFKLPGGSDGKASAYNAGDPGSIPASGRSSGERSGNPFQYSCLENLMDGRTQLAIVHGAAKSRMRLHFHSSCLEFKFLDYVDFTKMHQNWEALSHCFFKDFFCFLSNSHDMMFDLFVIAPQFSEVLFIFYLVFSLCSDWIICIDLS